MIVQDPVKEIIKRLDKITAAGVRPPEVFRDWIDLTEATLEQIPAHAKSLAETGQMAEDPDEMKALWDRLRKKYGRYDRATYYFNLFAEAFALLIDSNWRYYDTLGDVYMQFAYPKPGSGQFFTPYNVASMMARMMLLGIEKQIHQRIIEAAKRDPVSGSMVLASLMIDDPQEAEKWLVQRIVPAVLAARDESGRPIFEPFSICDPACGSGVMFIAAAEVLNEVLPGWMLGLGLVRFYGMDIDLNCVKMARINCAIYGLNDWGIKWALAASEVEAASMPYYGETYVQAQAAHQAGDQKTVEQLKAE